MPTPQEIAQNISQIPLLTPQQQGLQNQLISQLMPLLQSSQRNQFNFEPIANQARSNFYNQTIPSLAERFSSMGGIGSSGFRNTLGQAGAGLEESLAALQSQYGLQQQGMNQSNLINLLGLGLKAPFENIYQQPSPGFGASFGQGLGQATGFTGTLLAKLLGNYFGLPL